MGCRFIAEDEKYLREKVQVIDWGSHDYTCLKGDGEEAS